MIKTTFGCEIGIRVALSFVNSGGRSTRRDPTRLDDGTETAIGRPTIGRPEGAMTLPEDEHVDTRAKNGRSLEASTIAVSVSATW